MSEEHERTDLPAEKPEDAHDPVRPVEPETVRLIRRVQQGDRAALEALFERYLPRVRQIVAFKMQQPVNSLATHEDIVQEALIRAYKNIGEFDTRSAGTFYAYMAKCVQSAIVDAMRTEGAKRRGEGKVRPVGEFDLAACLRSEGDRTPSAIVGGREMSRKIEAAMLALGAKDRNLLMYRYLCGMSYGEIADALRIDQPSSIRVACLRARRKLEAALGA